LPLSVDMTLSGKVLCFLIATYTPQSSGTRSPF
jgi:hypothetical protein